MPKTKEQWYDNKELFQMICELKEVLQETTSVIKKYNSLREELGELGLEQRLQAKEIIIIQADEVKTRAIAEARASTKTTMVDYLIKLWPLILMTILFILSQL
jgi:hypothetical protein